jgi:class 3 adenylate cyclase
MLEEQMDDVVAVMDAARSERAAVFAQLEGGVDGPARGIRCATAIRETARSQFDLEVRSGLHTGEIEVIGNDVGGIAVHIGARVGASAGPEEVLVSGTGKDLVVGSGIPFEDRGERELKGVPGTWRLGAVAA